MFRYLLTATTLSLVLFLFTACVAQPKAPKTQVSKQTNANLWAENTNVDMDENDNVDVSDLDKNVTSGDQMQSSLQIVQRIAFPAGEYAALARTGKGTIQGNIYLQDAYGKKIYGRKTRLYLNPVTSYSRQWYEQSYIAGSKMGKADSRLFNYLKFTASDESGSFAFYGVPSGRYYLIGTVTCSTECGYTNSMNIRIAAEVLIEGNQVINQDMSRGI